MGVENGIETLFKSL